MPLFSLKFSPKKIPPRKHQVSSQLREFQSSQSPQDFDINYGAIKMRLGDNECLFQNGEWIVGGPNVAKELLKLRKQNEQLVQENNLLQLKVDVLLDMLAETTAEHELQEAELGELRSGRKFKK